MKVIYLDACKEFGLTVVHEDELPGLTVDSRGCKAHTLADVVQLLRLDGTVLILAAAVACLAKVFEIHSFVFYLVFCNIVDVMLQAFVEGMVA